MTSYRGTSTGRPHTAMAADADDIRDVGVQNIYKVVRALKKDDHGIHNCLRSIAHDAAFVREACRARFPGFPVFANLRCGAWYVAPREDEDEDEDEDDEANEDADAAAMTTRTCYFKSTDGHNNNWSFSATRLNAHVAEAAATRGGCVVVDATRSATKRFPDSMSKTIPVWAEVLNRGVAESRRLARDARGDEAEGTAAADDDDATSERRDATAAADAAADDYDDDGPHLPLWVSDVERASIRAKMDDFVATLRSSGADLSTLCETLRRPLRCVWVSSETRSWPKVTDASLPFTPIVLLSASAPLCGRGERRSTAEGDSFAYVPGAGDDEESWARGLTARAFWRRRRDIFAAGPGGCARAVDAIVEATEGGGGGGSSSGGGRRRRREDLPPRDGDASRLDPVGCLSAKARDAAAARLGALHDGATRDIVGHGLVLGSREAIRCARAWERVDAVLYVGGDAPTGPEGVALPNPAAAAATATATATATAAGDAAPPPPAPKPYLHVPMHRAKVARNDVANGLPAALKFIRERSAGGGGGGGGGGVVLVACEDGFDHCVGVAVARIASSRLHGSSAPRVSKEAVRKCLAEVSRQHPESRPSRGTLKQVFNFLFAGDGGGGGGGGGGEE